MEHLYHLLRIFMGTSDGSSFPILSEEQWKELMECAKKQMLMGVTYGGFEQLPSEKQPPRPLKLKWIATVKMIKKRNEWLNYTGSKVSAKLTDAGYECILLKGQGLGLLYPESSYRIPGDIDLWIKFPDTKRGINSQVKSLIERLRAFNFGELGKAVYHHIEWHMPNTEAEIHIRPMAFNNPFVNNRFQQWASTTKATWNDTLNCSLPDAEFNLVFILAHIYHHILFEGVGLKQLMDYAFVLQSTTGMHKERKHARKMIRSLKMESFAKGIMWIMKEKFHLSNEALLFGTNETMGRFLLNEIEQSGNFGRFDERLNHEHIKGGTVVKFIERTKHRMRFISRFPSEIFWDIPFRLWHWTWRLRWT